MFEGVWEDKLSFQSEYVSCINKVRSKDVRNIAWPSNVSRRRLVGHCYSLGKKRTLSYKRENKRKQDGRIKLVPPVRFEFGFNARYRSSLHIFKKELGREIHSYHFIIQSVMFTT